MDLRQLQKKYNLSDIEVYRQSTTLQKLSFIANKLKQTESTFTNGIAVRLVNKKKIGFASNYFKGEPLEKENLILEELIIRAKELSDYSEELNIKFPDKVEISEIKNNLNNETPWHKFKETGEIIVNEILSSTKTGTPLVDVSFEASGIKTSLGNTRGLSYSYSNKTYSFSCSVRETLENDFTEIYMGETSNLIPDHKVFLSKLLKFYKLSKKHAKIKNGTWPVLITSKAAKDLLDTVENALSGKNVNEKSSPWTGKIENQILSRLITIKQDPGFGYMARSCDDEGIPVQPLCLVENGILKNFYYDLLSSQRSMINQTATGNGFRKSVSAKPEPDLLNMIISPGGKSLDEIIKNINYGLLVDQTIGGLTTNISGDMSVNVDLGFLIEKGELNGRVKDTMISGNVYNALNNVIELSNNPGWHQSNTYTPDILTEGFTVTSK